MILHQDADRKCLIKRLHNRHELSLAEQTSCSHSRLATCSPQSRALARAAVARAMTADAREMGSLW